jgi:hypothetical protein
MGRRSRVPIGPGPRGKWGGHGDGVWKSRIPYKPDNRGVGYFYRTAKAGHLNG